MKEIQGVLPVFCTPFHADESIDFTTLEREIDWLLDQGCDGVVMGMVSEILRLSGAERKQVAETVCRRCGDKGLAIISAGAESTHTALDYARHAESVGANALMVTAPIAFPAGEAELGRYYEAILDAVSIPVVVQDASGYVGQPMSIDFQASLYARYPEQVIFKPEAFPMGPRLSALRDATGGRAPILEGTGGIFLVDSFRRGIAGTMPGADLIDGIVALWRALQAGDDDTVYALSAPISAIVSMLDSLDAFLAVEKYLLHKRGIFPTTVVRGPVGYTLDAETQAEIDRLFARMVAALDRQDQTQ